MTPPKNGPYGPGARPPPPPPPDHAAQLGERRSPAEHQGVSFQPAERGQFSTVLDNSTAGGGIKPHPPAGKPQHISGAPRFGVHAGPLAWRQDD